MSMITCLKKTVAVSACLAFSQLSFAGIGEREAQIDSLFEDYLSDGAATAAAVEIRERLSNGTFVTRYRKSYGTLSRGDSKETPLDVLMRQASVSKSPTVIAAARLIAENRLARSTTVFCEEGEIPRNGTTPNDNCIVPLGEEFDDEKYHQITVDHLMNHLSGLDQGNLRPSDAFDHVLTPTMADVIDEMRQTDLRWDPGSRYEYINVGYNLLAHVIERASPQQDYIAYLRSVAGSIGICQADLRLASPLFSGRVRNREPEYYTFDSWTATNFFEYPDGSETLGDRVAGPNGGGLYGRMPGAGGLLMTTRAMLLFAEEFHLETGMPRSDDDDFIRGGSGPGTLSILAQNQQDRYDYAFMFNSNEPDSVQKAFDDAFKAEVALISPTPPEQNSAAIAASSSYDTHCGTLSNIEEPNHEIAAGTWKYFNISNADRVTLHNLDANADLYVKKGTSNPTASNWDCRPNASGRQREVCNLNSSDVYRIGIFGVQSGRYMIDVNYPSSPVEAPGACGTRAAGFVYEVFNFATSGEYQRALERASHYCASCTGGVRSTGMQSQGEAFCR